LAAVLAGRTPALSIEDPDQASDLTSLREAFVRPPEDSKIMMRWWWFGPAVSNGELEREMRRMKAAGIGGFEVQPVYPLALDDPSRGFKNDLFLSDAFIQALRFASSKAQELGLRMDLTLGSGWPYGGPSVPVIQAAGQLRVEISPVGPAADRIPLPHIGAGEELLAVFLAQGEPGHFAAESAKEISGIEGGAVRVPTGFARPHVLLFFIASRTGQTVKRPAVGAEGFVLDHYDRAALDAYLGSVGDRLMQAFPGNPPRAIFCDSLEVYGSDWTGSFLEEFRKRRGYDLKPYLPALVGNIGEQTGAIRHDWGKTLTELFNERFVSPLEEWAHLEHTLLRAQLYGTPPAVLSSYALVDLTEGEGARWKGFAPTRWASSASHVYGRVVTSSETWTWLHSPAFRATPLDLKAEADVHFLEGINQLVGHGWPYSPPQAGEPGWRFYAAAALNQHNPWWFVMPDLALYLQRVSFILRQGKPVNGVAIYLPTDDAWAHFVRGQTSVSEAMETRLGPFLIARLLEAGYGFDFVDDGALNRFAQVENGTLVLNGNRYGIVILPGVERMPSETLQKLDRFAQQGGVLVATHRTPALAPGLMDAETESRRIGELSKRLFEGAAPRARLVNDVARELAQVLHERQPPDVSFSPASPDIGFVHRRASWADIYFVANTGNQAQSTQATFRVEGAEPEWWDPLTGETYAASVLGRTEAGTTKLSLYLEPYGSRILVFSRRPLGLPKPGAVEIRENLPPPIDLSAGWKVTFLEVTDEGDTLQPEVPRAATRTGKSVFMDHLRSWTVDEGTRFFSGEAVYEKTFNLPASLTGSAADLWLDFGEGAGIPPLPGHRDGMQAWFEGPVREAAVVYVNGQRAGSVWHPPYTAKLTGLLRAGENELRIVVANTAINGMAGTTLPDYRLLNSRYGERFTPQDVDRLQPLPSGLLGAVRLVARPAQPTPYRGFGGSAGCGRTSRGAADAESSATRNWPARSGKGGNGGILHGDPPHTGNRGRKSRGW
jgi:hypothetical protein